MTSLIDLTLLKDPPRKRRGSKVVANISLDFTWRSVSVIFVHTHHAQQIHLYSDFRCMLLISATPLNSVFIWIVEASPGSAVLFKKG